MIHEDFKQDLLFLDKALDLVQVMLHEDVTQDPYRALAFCQGVLEILQGHYLPWCRSALSEGNTELAVQNLDLVESCTSLVAKTIADTLEKMAKGAIPWPQKRSGS